MSKRRVSPTDVGGTRPRGGGDGVADTCAGGPVAAADNGATARPLRTRPEVTIIIPTRNEAGNVPELVQRLGAGLRREAEVLFVDDSDDDTPEVIRRAAASSRHRVGLLHRPPAERTHGLGGAVAAGLTVAKGSWVVVMDGDLQHPPEVVPALLDTAAATGADVVVASRYTAQGGAEGLAGRRRSWVSHAATWGARALFPRRLRPVTDPMSGFFAVRRGCVDVEALHPHGFKILLEILLRGPRLPVAEVPFTFAARHAGRSKAGLREGLRFGRHVTSLRLSLPASSRATLARAVGFGSVGLSGVAVNLGVLWVLADPSTLAMQHLLAAALATQASTLWNFALTEVAVFRGRRSGSLVRRLLAFAALNNLVLLLRLPLLAVLVSALQMNYLAANALTLALAFLTRFRVVDRHIYREEVPDMTMNSPGPAEPAAIPEPVGAAPGPQVVPAPVVPGPGSGTTTLPLVPSQPPPPAVETVRPLRAPRRPPVDVVLDLLAAPPAAARRGTGYLPYRYDIAGLVTVGSQVVLRELEYFREPTLGKDLDIEIRVGDVGSGRARTRAQLSRTAGPMSLRFEEHLGRLGANFEVRTEDAGLRVCVTPLLARSPHVLYTNVLEALLRFVMVQQGRMLLHSACLELDGRGVMLSARTDTGKTGTVLRLLREQPSARFLSDDMTLLQPDATARCFPKPLTISAHTLRAVDPGDLSSREWRRLRVQSRVHSKEGRQWGLMLGELNIPLMTINAITQMVVPPPKYVVDRLVPAAVVPTVRVQDLFVIERGPAALSHVDPAEALSELIANTDDAYGFPPFRYFAPALVLGRDDYDTLRDRERDVLAAALRSIQVRRLASPDFGWADEIPRLLREGREQAPRQRVG